MTADNLASLSLKDLKAQADDLGLHYHPNIGHAKLLEKILAVADEPAPDAAPAESTGGVILSPPVQPEAAEKPLSEALTPPHTATQTGVLPDPEARKFLEMCSPANVQNALAVHVRRGLQIVELDEQNWHLKIGNREDSGNMKMPLKTLVQCANLLMVRSAEPTEGMTIEDIVKMKAAAVR